MNTPRIAGQSWGRSRPAFLASLAFASAVAGLVAIGGAQSRGDGLDPGLPRYEAGSAALEGRIRAVGAAAPAALVVQWGDAFRALHPKVQFDVTGGDAGVQAFLKGEAEIAALTRPLTSAERAQFRGKRGFEPIEVPVAIDAVAISVHKDNPIAGLAVADVARLFGTASPARTWADVGATGDWAATPVLAFGLRADSAAGEVIRAVALGGGALRQDLKVQPGASGVVNGVATERGGVGFASRDVDSRATRRLPIAASKGQAFVEASAANVGTGTYPLARPIVLAIARKPGDAAPLLDAFLRFVLSAEGQRIAAEEGVTPLTAAAARQSQQTVR